MEVSVEQTSELGRKMTITLPESAVQTQMAPRLKKWLAKRVLTASVAAKFQQALLQKCTDLKFVKKFCLI